MTALVDQSRCELGDLKERRLAAQRLGDGHGQSEMADDGAEPGGQVPASGQPARDGRVIEAPTLPLCFRRIACE